MLSSFHDDSLRISTVRTELDFHLPGRQQKLGILLPAFLLYVDVAAINLKDSAWQVASLVRSTSQQPMQKLEARQGMLETIACTHEWPMKHHETDDKYLITEETKFKKRSTGAVNLNVECEPLRTPSRRHQGGPMLPDVAVCELN